MVGFVSLFVHGVLGAADFVYFADDGGDALFLAFGAGVVWVVGG